MKTSFTVLSPTFVERDINGETVRFYPISVYTFGKLSKVISKLGRCISVLLGASKDESGHVIENFAEEGGVVGDRFTKTPINPELARLRTEQRGQAVEDAISTLLDPQNLPSVAEMIFASMRDETKERRPTKTDLEEFVKDVDIPTLVNLIIGVGAANAKVFGGGSADLGKLVEARVAEALGRPAQTETDGQPSNQDSSGS